MPNTGSAVSQGLSCAVNTLRLQRTTGLPTPLTVAEGDAQAHEEGDGDQPKAGAVLVNEGEPEDASL